MGRKKIKPVSGSTGFSFLISSRPADSNLSNFIRNELSTTELNGNQSFAIPSESLDFTSLSSPSSVTSRARHAASTIRHFIRESTFAGREAAQQLAVQKKQRQLGLQTLTFVNDTPVAFDDDMSEKIAALSMADASEALGPIGSSSLPDKTRELLNYLSRLSLHFRVDRRQLNKSFSTRQSGLSNFIPPNQRNVLRDESGRSVPTAQDLNCYGCIESLTPQQEQPSNGGRLEQLSIDVATPSSTNFELFFLTCIHRSFSILVNLFVVFVFRSRNHPLIQH